METTIKAIWNKSKILKMNQVVEIYYTQSIAMKNKMI